MAGSSSDGFDYVPFPNKDAAPAPATASSDGFTYVPFANTSVAPAPPPSSSDGFAYVPFTTQAAQTTAPAEPTNDESDPNEGAIGKAWDAINKPLTETLFGWGPHRKGAGGIEAGIEDTLTGLTSPLSVGLTLATAGAGGLLESLGLDLGKMAAPEVINAAKTAGKLAAAGFTAQQLYGIAQESPFFVQAVKDGDTQKALEIGTSSLLQGGMALFGAKHAIGDLLASPESMKANVVSSLIGRYQDLLKDDTQTAKKFNDEFKDAVRSAPQREAIHFYAQAGGDMGKLAAWQKQVEEANDLNPQLQRQLVDDLKRAQLINDQATPNEMAWAQRLREFYAGNFDRAVSAGVLAPESRRENYVAHPRWMQDNVEAQNVADAQNAIQGSGKDNHTKQRVFGSTIEGILSRDENGKLLGFTPKKVGGRYMLDAADLASDYRLSIGKEIAKKDFIDTLLKTRMADNRPGAVPSGMATEFDSKPVLDADGNVIEQSRPMVSINGDIIPDRPLNRSEVRFLRKQGLFQAMIDNGLIKDLGDRVVETAPAQSAEPVGVTVNKERVGPRSYADVQADIDRREDELEQSGQQVTKLYFPEHADVLSKAPGWKPMPPDLVKLYEERDAIGSKQLQGNIDELTQRLKQAGITDEAEQRRILGHYSLDPNRTDAGKQYLASEYTLDTVNSDPREQAANIYSELAAERGIPMDDRGDLWRDRKTTQDALAAVKAVTSYFHPNETPEIKGLLPETAEADAGEYGGSIGELRKDVDGKHTLWLGQDALQILSPILGGKADSILNGVSLNKFETAEVLDELNKKLESGDGTPEEQYKTQQVIDLLKQADAVADKSGVVLAQNRSRSVSSAVKMLREEYNHRWQKLWSKDGRLMSHLTPQQYKQLGALIPKAAHAYFDYHDYLTGPTRVIETSARLLAGQGKELGVSDEEAVQFLKQYLNAVKQNHGAEALESLKHVVGVARQVLQETKENDEGSVSDRRGVEGVSGDELGRRPPGTDSKEQGQARIGNANQEFQGDDGRTYVETEHVPGQELPITPKPEEDIQAKLQKLPEHMQQSVRELEQAVQEHQRLVETQNPNPDHDEAVERSKENLSNLRDDLEDEFEGQKFPKGVRKAALDYIRQLAPSEDEEFDAKNYRGRYRYDTHDYDNSIRHPYARKSVYGGAEDQFLNAPLAIHPQMLKTAKAILAPEKSWFERNAVTKRVMDISNEAKKTLLSFSGFHWVQEGLKGLESGLGLKTIFNPKGWDMNDPAQRRLIRAGGIQPGIQGGANAFAEGLKGDGLQSYIPGIGPWMDSINDKLFGPDGYIDRLKLQAALKFDERLQKMYPKLDETTRLKVAGQMANNRFGGQNYLALGRSPMARDIMRLAVLAPDWFESQARDAGMLVGPYAKMRGQDLARIALYNFIAAQTLNKLNTGHFHLDTPFGVQSQDGKKVYTVRTLPSDLFHAATNFRDYISNRMNPIVTRTAVEALTGRDKQGKLRDMGEQVKDLFSNVIPIPMHSAFDLLTGNAMPNESVMDSVRSGLGMTTKTNPTPAESLAYKLASENQATGHVPSEQIAKFHSILNLENRLRDGDQSAVQDLQTQYRSGKLAFADVQSILKGAKTTRLASIVNRLPMSNALDVWNLTTDQERQQLAPVMLKKMVNFQRTEREKLTPAEQSSIDTRLAQVMHELMQPTQQ